MEYSSTVLGLIGALIVLVYCAAAATDAGQAFPSFGPLVAKESRRTLVRTESGQITAVDVQDGYRGAYHLQFITMDPASLFLPVLLHTDMVFYVHSGRGTVTYNVREGEETEEIDVARGDVYRLEGGTTFYLQSHPDATRQKLRIHAVFDTSDIANPLGLSMPVYSNISDLVRGFDEKVLQMGFGVSEETILAIKSIPSPPSIVPSGQRNETEPANWKEGIIESLFGLRGSSDIINKKKKQQTKIKTINFFKTKPDVENHCGWSTALTYKDLKALKGSNLAPFMVNLTKGSMMGPHWNPRATEIAVVIGGQGMVQIVCPSDPSGKVSEGYKCQTSIFKVKDGDLFVVPRFHPMTQISYNDDVLAFVGFSSMAKNNHPQFLAGKRSVLRVIDPDVLAASFNLANASVVKELLGSQEEWAMLPCPLCADQMERMMEEEMRRKGEEEEAAARKREEEEASRKEEEAARKREEEEAKRKEEEEARKREEEEEAARREEEEAKSKKEEEARRREEEAAAKRKEEEEARKRKEEEEAARREEEDAKSKKEEEARRREEEAAAKRREDEEARQREAKEAERKKEEEARREEEEAEEGRRREEERREEARKREEEEAEEGRRGEEERREEARKREEEEAEEYRRREEEEGEGWMERTRENGR